MINLNENNWSIWKAKIEDLLYCKDLYALIKGDKAKSTRTLDDEWKKATPKDYWYNLTMVG